ncbi:MAG: transglycosylase SLT domain-containing protein [Roseinatronobacter sp.]
MSPDIACGIVESSRTMQFQPGLLSAINSAANRHGVDPAALQTIAWLESRGKVDAKNPNSSASGPFQFITSTARDYGLTNPFDAEASSDAAARLARDNSRHLTRVLGRAPNPAELYLAHQQGAGGAAKLLADPNRRAVDVVGAEAVRLNGGREDMTAGEFANLWLNKAGSAFRNLTGGDYTPPAQEQMRPVGGQQMQGQQGLLGAIGAPDTKRKTYKSLGEAIKASAADGSIWDNIAVSLNSMRGDMADPGINQMAQGRMQSREQERVANATAEWLRQNGREDLAGAIEGGMINGAQAFEMMQGPGPVEGKVVGDNLVNPYTGEVIGNYAQEQGQYQVITGETAAAYGLDPTVAYRMGPDGKVEQIGGNGTSIDINMGDGAPGIGKLSTDYGYVLDPETRQPVIDPATGLPTAAPVPGSAAARDLEAQEAARTGMETMTERQLGPTIDDIATARDLAETGVGTTGMLSGLIQRIPGVGQDAVDMAGTIGAIGSGISLENLNQMRQNSPTGGALGNVSDKQSLLLAEAFGSLRQSMSKDQFIYNLARIENSLNDIVHGEGNGPQRHDMTALRGRLRGGAAPAAPANTATAPATPQRRRFNPATGEFE